MSGGEPRGDVDAETFERILVEREREIVELEAGLDRLERHIAETPSSDPRVDDVLRRLAQVDLRLEHVQVALENLDRKFDAAAAEQLGYLNRHAQWEQARSAGDHRSRDLWRLVVVGGLIAVVGVVWLLLGGI